MKCIICSSQAEYYFSKTYTEHPYNELMREIGEVKYYKCTHCGFTISKTHAELESEKWAFLNKQFHHELENLKLEKKGNQPPYVEQAIMLMLLGKNNIIDISNMLDYASGYGTLSNILNKYFKVHLPIYDPFIKGGDPARYVQHQDIQPCKTVINSSMFEHILTREDIDNVNALVDVDGCLVIHTVICENIPRNPDWFFLRPPVHTAFHTNKSMDILMDQWGYNSSIYCPQSKCWILLRSTSQHIPELLTSLNTELQTDWFHYKVGFMDYWKGF